MNVATNPDTGQWWNRDTQRMLSPDWMREDTATVIFIPTGAAMLWEIGKYNARHIGGR